MIFRLEIYAVSFVTPTFTQSYLFHAVHPLRH